MNRRKFMKSVAGAGAVVGAGAGIIPSIPTLSAAAVPTVASGIRLGISSYSYWHFRDPRMPIEEVIDRAAALNVSGVDILHRQMESQDNAYLQKLKRHAFRRGIDLICLSIHQDFVDPDKSVRESNINHTKKCIRLAHALGIPCIRLNSGRWGTIPSFDDLMAQKGIEPPIPGYTEQNAFEWCIDSIEKCLPTAEKYGVHLALENHWGLTRSPEGLLRIARAIRSQWLGVLMDTGNFLDDPYPKLEQIAPFTTFVQAKTYYGEGEWYTLDLDYHRIASILNEAGYTGYVSLEFEGKADPNTGVPQSVALLKEAFGIQ